MAPLRLAFACMAAWLFVTGCQSAAETADLEVALRSDMLGGQDFAVVLTEISSENGTIQSSTLQAVPAMDFVSGVSVANWDHLSHGNYGLQVKLIGADGRLVARSEYRVVTLTQNFVSKVALNRRGCDAVVCDAGSQCLNGSCIVSTCVANPGADICKVPTPNPGDDAGPGTPDSGPVCTENCNVPDGGPAPECTNGAMAACTNGACTGTRTCTANHWGACSASAPAAEALDGIDNNCNGQTDEGFWVQLHQVPWSAIGNGCDQAFASFASCQAGADAWCRATNNNYLGGYGPVEFDLTNTWIVCLAKGGGAVRITTDAAGFGKSGVAARTREGQTQATTFCGARGYPLSVGAVAWAGDDTAIDVICMPQSYGENRVVTQQVISDNQCADWGTFANTPGCTRPAHRYCTFAGFYTGVGPYWVYGDAPLACLNDL